jgi:site-specific DNA recombinase
MRAAIYARYSTDLSIDDQIRECKKYIAHKGWTLVKVYSDPAMSGASEFRPQYQAMRTATREHVFDVIVAEAMDRLTRDQEEIAGLYKHLKFAGVQILTVAEGPMNEMLIGFKGAMNAQFLTDLGAKTHRGLEGRIAAGKSAGGLRYGYSVVRQTDARGELIRGDRSINQAEAIVVRRIFQMFADGSSPIAIAKRLNDEKIPGPRSGGWRDTTIRGHAAPGYCGMSSMLAG